MENEKLTALIVDSDLASAAKLSLILYEMGSADLVLYASDCTEAISVLRNQTINVLLTEIMFPGRNGTELLRTVKQSNIQVRAIVISNHANSYYRELCSSLGAAYFFDKSDDFEKIPFIISQLRQNRLAGNA